MNVLDSLAPVFEKIKSFNSKIVNSELSEEILLTCDQLLDEVESSIYSLTKEGTVNAKLDLIWKSNDTLIKNAIRKNQGNEKAKEVMQNFEIESNLIIKDINELILLVNHIFEVFKLKKLQSFPNYPHYGDDEQFFDKLKEETCKIFYYYRKVCFSSSFLNLEISLKWLEYYGKKKIDFDKDRFAKDLQNLLINISSSYNPIRIANLQNRFKSYQNFKPHSLIIEEYRRMIDQSSWLYRFNLESPDFDKLLNFKKIITGVGNCLNGKSTFWNIFFKDKFHKSKTLSKYVVILKHAYDGQIGLYTSKLNKVTINNINYFEFEENELITSNLLQIEAELIKKNSKFFNSASSITVDTMSELVFVLKCDIPFLKDFGENACLMNLPGISLDGDFNLYMQILKILSNSLGINLLISCTDEIESTHEHNLFKKAFQILAEGNECNIEDNCIFIMNKKDQMKCELDGNESNEMNNQKDYGEVVHEIYYGKPGISKLHYIDSNSSLRAFNNPVVKKVEIWGKEFPNLDDRNSKFNNNFCQYLKSKLMDLQDKVESNFTPTFDEVLAITKCITEYEERENLKASDKRTIQEVADQLIKLEHFLKNQMGEITQDFNQIIDDISKRKNVWLNSQFKKIFSYEIANIEKIRLSDSSSSSERVCLDSLKSRFEAIKIALDSQTLSNC